MSENTSDITKDFNRPMPPLVYQGKTCFSPDDFGFHNGPSYYLKKLREGSDITIIAQLNSKGEPYEMTALECIHRDMADYNLTYVDFGTSAEELDGLVAANARLQAMVHLVKSRGGMAHALFDLEWFEKLRMFLGARYEDFGTTQEELQSLTRQMHLNAASNLLKELRLPHHHNQAKEFEELAKHLSDVSAAPEEIGTSADELSRLKRQNLVFRGVWYLRRLRESIDFYKELGDKDPMEIEFSSFRLCDTPFECVEKIEDIRTLLDAHYNLFEITEAEFNDLSQQAGFIEILETLKRLEEHNSKKSSWMTQEDYAEMFARIETIAQKHAIEYSLFKYSPRKYAKLKKRLGVN